MLVLKYRYLPAVIVSIIVTVFQFAPLSVKESVSDWMPGGWWIIVIHPRIARQLLGMREACQRYGWYEGESCTMCSD